MFHRRIIIQDFQIVQTVLQGDSEAFTALVRAYQARVLTLCLSFLLSRAEAEDAAQDVFVKAFASLDQYKRDLSFSAWLCRIASNHCLDVLRKKKRQKTESLDRLMDPEEEWGVAVIPALVEQPAGDPEKETKVALAVTVLSQLSEDYRQILVLRELEGLSYEEIRLTLNCSLDAVKARLRRARQQLQEKARHFSEDESLVK